MEASGNTIDCDRDSVIEVSEDDANQIGIDSDLSNDSLEIGTDYGPKSATGDYLMSSDTEEVAINSACMKFKRKV